MWDGEVLFHHYQRRRMCRLWQNQVAGGSKGKSVKEESGCIRKMMKEVSGLKHILSVLPLKFYIPSNNGLSVRDADLHLQERWENHSLLRKARVMLGKLWWSSWSWRFPLNKRTEQGNECKNRSSRDYSSGCFLRHDWTLLQALSHEMQNPYSIHIQSRWSQQSGLLN